MELRLAEYKDYERIAQLHADSWKRHYRGILTNTYLDSEAIDDKLLIWQTRLTNPPFNQHIVLAEEGACYSALSVSSAIMTLSAVHSLMLCMLMIAIVVEVSANNSCLPLQSGNSNTSKIQDCI